MKNVGLVYHEIYLQHDTGFHPESPDRLRHTIKHLSENGLYGEHASSKYQAIAPEKASPDQIHWLHDSQLIENISTTAQRAAKNGQLLYADGDGVSYGETAVSAATYDAALYAVGGNFTAIEQIFAGKIDKAFVLCRPPGHHSNAYESRGFCIFNNIALATEYLIRKKGVKRVAIFDFDAHAGNGTEELLNMRTPQGDERILFFSLHQHPRTLYPGTCFAQEIGEEAQKGYTVNLTFLPYSSNPCVKVAMDKLVLPMMHEFHPEFILVSAGYDAHHIDPLTAMGYQDQTFYYFIDQLNKIAEESAHGRIQCTLEGGYNLKALGNSIANTIAGLAEDKPLFTEPEEFNEPSDALTYTENNLLPQIQEFLNPYWKCLH